MSSFFSWLTSPVLRKPAELELPAQPEIPSAAPAEGDDTEVPFVDRGMKLPDSYGVDIVRALVQDPFHLMVYWEIRVESLRALEGLFPGGAGEFRPTMRLTDLTEGSEAYVHVPLQGKYWFVVSPTHQYRVDVGALSTEHGFVPVVRSNVVETPRGTVSTTVSDDPRYRVATHDFVKLLEVTGFANDKVLSDIARADANRAAGAEPRLDAPPSFLVEAFGKLPAPVKEAAVTIAEGGTLTPAAVDTLPDELRSILRGFGAGDEELLTSAFMHLLPQWLRDLLEGHAPGDGPWRLHLPARFAIGGSELLQRPHVDWSWMPSMTESVTRRRAPHLEPDALDSVPSE